MKKLFSLLGCFVFTAQILNAQQQVWESQSEYQIRNIISNNNKIIYATTGIEVKSVFAVNGNENASVFLGNFDEVSRFTAFGNKVVFIGRKGYDINIWLTDGTPQGTTALTNFSHASISNIAVFKNKVYFTNYNALYYSDGTEGSTQILLSLPYESEIPPSISLLYALEDKLIYCYYGQLMVTDGNSSAIKTLADNTTVPVTGVLSGAGAVTVNNKLIFIKHSADTGDELWVTDGTDAHTFLLKDINPGVPSGFETIDYSLKPYFTASNGKLYFVANKGTGRSVWVTDGTLNGTNELYIGSNTNNPVSLKSIDGNVYFSNSYGDGLYFSDGLNNTVKNIGGTESPFDAYSFTEFNGSVYFVASDTEHGYELWKTDNTASSTIRVTDICEGSCSTFNHYTGLTACGNILFFSASNTGYEFDEYGNLSGNTDYQLWKLTGNSIPNAIRSKNIQKINAYPNPCQEYITIQLQESVSSVKIISAVGSEADVNWQQNSNTLRVQTQALYPGLYMLLINGKESVSIIKE